jgi:uncharacterized protein YdeI (YjbR/CyaY-like superfamily)
MKMDLHTADKAEIIDCAHSADWEAWLARHYERPSGIWLRIAKKGAGQASVSISEALDIALCYGWIDSQRKGYDQAYYLQRYSPRRPKSPWSKLNVERAEALIAASRMQPAGRVEIEAAKADGRWETAYESQRNVMRPPDLAAALAQNERAKKTFDRLDKSGQYAVILPILKANTADRRAARLQKAITRLEAGDQE